MGHDDPIGRLARQIDASRKSERLLVSAEEIAALRRRSASELHRICSEFVSSLNARLSQARLELAPPTYAPEMFRDRAVNLMQVSSQGRQMQVVFQATHPLFSIDKYSVPYILEGEIRTYNQSMLEHFEIRNQSLFYCIDDGAAFWRFFDWRNPRVTAVDADLLARLMQPLF